MSCSGVVVSCTFVVSTKEKFVIRVQLQQVTCSHLPVINPLEKSTKILFLSSPSWRGQGREDGRAMLSGSQMVSSMISGNSHGLSSYLSDDIEFLPIVGSANSHSQFIFKQCSCIALGFVHQPCLCYVLLFVPSLA